MGDEDIDHDSIWMPASEAPADPPAEADAVDAAAADPAAESGDVDDAYDPEDPDDLWGRVDRDAAAEGRPPRSRVRTALGIGCLVIAAVAGVAIVQGNDEPSPRAVGQAVSTTPDPDPGKVLSSEKDAPAQQLAAGDASVPSTVPEGAVVKCGDWDAAASFAPESLPAGVVIWSDFQGWHVRASGPDVGEVTGRITGTVPPHVLDQAEADRVDVSTPEGGNDLYFTIRPGDDPQGFDFSAGCAQKLLTFDLKADAQTMDPALVHLGRSGGVEAVPFMVSRIPEPS